MRSAYKQATQKPIKGWLSFGHTLKSDRYLGWIQIVQETTGPHQNTNLWKNITNFFAFYVSGEEVVILSIHTLLCKPIFRHTYVGCTSVFASFQIRRSICCFRRWMIRTRQSLTSASRRKVSKTISIVALYPSNLTIPSWSSRVSRASRVWYSQACSTRLAQCSNW